MADYAEQVLITGVKDRQHCTVCKIPPIKRTVLVHPARADKTTAEHWPIRTHFDTRQMINLQVSQGTQSREEQYVHAVENFAWDYPHVNIHEALVPDLLHQLHKGIVKHSVDWLSGLLAREFGSTKGDPSSAVCRLDERYRAVPEFPGLKVFHGAPVSRIVQLTGTDQRAMLRQMVPVYAPLLRLYPDAMRYLRALCDFVTLSHYHSHDEATLGYLLDALERIDTYKWELKNSRKPNADGERHFNIPKFHAITHYLYFIRKFGPLPHYDPGTFTEAPHMYLVKVFFAMTNKKQTLEQITTHNTRLVRQQALEAVLQCSPAPVINSDAIEARTMRLGVPLDLRRTPWQRMDVEAVIAAGQPCRTCITVLDVASQPGMEEFLAAAAVFVREELWLEGGGQGRRSAQQADQLEPDPSWVGRFLVTVRPCIRYWKPTGRFETDSVGEDTGYLRCAPNWQGSGKWLRSWAWVQEFDPSVEDPLRGSRLGQVHLIFTLRDPERLHQTYTCLYMQMVQALDNGKPDPVHGMVVVRSGASRPRNRKYLQAHRCFSVEQFLRASHVVPSGKPNKLFVNNYVNFGEYNSLYRDDWLEDNQAKMREYRKRNPEYF
jgi:hypothetical protein